jgi:hypothetical protein
LKAWLLLGLASCGGAVVTGPKDAGVQDEGAQDANARDGPGATEGGPSVDASDEPGADSGPDAAALVACVQACIATTNYNCPVLLLYPCLSGPCGDPASTAICGGGNGVTPPPVSTIQCAQAAFPTCPGTCQGDSSCKAFVGCIDQCHE